MAILDAATTPSLFDRLTRPLRNLQHRVRRRHGRIDIALADFMEEAVHPGDKVLQLGADETASLTMLERGVFLSLVATASAADIVETACQTRGTDAGRLRVFTSLRASESTGTADVVFLTPTTGFAAQAAHLRHATTRLKTNGLLLIDGVDTVAGGRIYDALQADLGWRIDEVISGRVAVFRKTAAFLAA